MPNPTGINGRARQQLPPINELSQSLFLWQRLGYKLTQQLELLQKNFNYTISLRSLIRLRDKLKIPTATFTRKMDQEELKKAVQSVIGIGGEDAFRRGDEEDSNGLGVRRLRDHLATEKRLLVSNSRVRAILQVVHPEGLVRRFPGWHRPFRAVLQSSGWAEEWSGDGHEKLATRGLGLGSSVSFEVYGIKDKFSGYFVALDCVPDARDRATIAHLYLDAIEREGGCPRKFVVDSGTETNGAIEAQITFRTIFAPNLDMTEHPPFSRIRSVHNTVIEGAWSKFGREEGRHLRELIQSRAHEVDFEDETSLFLFRWIWSKVVQIRLDYFRETHNTSRVRSQAKKKMPSGHRPIRAKLGELGGENCLVPVPQAAIDQVRSKYAPALKFVDEEFDYRAQQAYRALGSPALARGSAWETFFSMLNLLS